MIDFERKEEITEVGVDKCLEWIYNGYINESDSLIEILYVAKELKLTKLIYEVYFPFKSEAEFETETIF